MSVDSLAGARVLIVLEHFMLGGLERVVQMHVNGRPRNAQLVAPLGGASPWRRCALE